MTKREIMSRAHRIARAAVQRFGGKHSEYMAEALRMAWEESKEPQTVQELLQCPPEKLYEYLRRAAAKCPKWAETQTRPLMIDGEPARDPETGKLCGDVDFAAIEPKASVITPVPGGVGPMTICCLMENTIECFLRKMNK